MNKSKKKQMKDKGEDKVVKRIKICFGAKHSDVTTQNLLFCFT
jgi:hypothetical protein